jgi:hypothetical protein
VVRWPAGVRDGRGRSGPAVEQRPQAELEALAEGPGRQVGEDAPQGGPIARVQRARPGLVLLGQAEGGVDQAPQRPGGVALRPSAGEQGAEQGLGQVQSGRLGDVVLDAPPSRGSAGKAGPRGGLPGRPSPIGRGMCCSPGTPRISTSRAVARE